MEHKILPKLHHDFNRQSAWNHPSRIRYTNCYTYALDADDLSFLDLGALTKGGINNPKNFDIAQYSDPEGLRNLALKDGLESVSLSNLTPKERHTIAIMGAQIIVAAFPSWDAPLFTASEHFFHCMRLHGDYSMSEKGASHFVNNKNSDGKPLGIDNYQEHYKTLVNDYAEMRRRQNIAFSGAHVGRITDVGFFSIPDSGIVLTCG
jgi:hypothetical protein